MEITNLEINILYFMCDPHNGLPPTERIDSKAIFNEFSDIPEGSIESAIDTMANDRLITIDPTGATVAITKNGIDRLESSLVCRIHHFDRCRCGRPA
jgi:hypothetical protein